MANRTTKAILSRDVVSEADAYSYFERLRSNGAPSCAHCESSVVYFIEPGVSRATRTHLKPGSCVALPRLQEAVQRYYQYGDARPQDSGRVWLMVIFELCSSKNGVAVRKVEHKYGISGRSTWFMLHRIRT